MARRIVKKGEAGLLPVLMEADMRAVAVIISPESASGGFILPNDRVDLIMTYVEEIQNGNGPKIERGISRTLVQNVRVLAIDQTVSPGTAVDGEVETTRIGNTATLEVSSREAELVALSQNMGELTLALRPLDENAVSAPRNPRYEMNGGNLDNGNNVTLIRNSKSQVMTMGAN